MKYIHKVSFETGLARKILSPPGKIWRQMERKETVKANLFTNLFASGDVENLQIVRVSRLG